MTLANQLTLLRILLVPGLVILMVYGHFGWSLVVFALAAITDGLDGLAARLRKEHTDLGQLLDPLADKLLVTSALIVLSIPNRAVTVRIPPWIAILSISRDAGILLAVLVFNLALGRRSFPPSLLGKATTAVHLVTICWILWCNYRGQGGPVADGLLGLTVLFTVTSALHYLYLGHRIIAAEEIESR